MKNCFFVHHLGLGDELILCGLIKSLLNQYNNVYLPVKKHNVETVNKLYEEDFPFLKILPVENDLDMINLSKNYESIANIINNGIFGNEPKKQNEEFCQWFYRTANIDYENRWKLFSYVEQAEKLIQQNLYDKFIFVHDDKSRNFNISSKYLTGKNIFRPNHHLGASDKSTIFDYKKILLEAEEIHCMDSSFAILIEHIPELGSKNKFIHRYVRKDGGPLYKNNWKIIYEE